MGLAQPASAPEREELSERGVERFRLLEVRQVPGVAVAPEPVDEVPLDPQPAKQHTATAAVATVSADLARRPRDTTSTVIRDCFMADAAQTVLEAGSTGSTRASTAGGWAKSRPPRRQSGHPSCEHVFVS